MRGLVFLGDRQVALRTFPDPTPGPDEVIIGMQASGLCGSDFRPYRAPRVPAEREALLPISGHEPCGVVVARGAHVTDAQARIGARAMIHHYHVYGVCKHSLIGFSHMCLRGG